MSGRRRPPPAPPGNDAVFNDASDPGMDDFDSVRGIKLGVMQSDSVGMETGADGRPVGLLGQSNVGKARYI